MSSFFDAILARLFRTVNVQTGFGEGAPKQRRVSKCSGPRAIRGGFSNYRNCSQQLFSFGFEAENLGEKATVVV